MDEYQEQLENQCASIDMLEIIAKPVLENLVDWVSKNILSNSIGALKYELMLNETVNACVTRKGSEPFEVNIIITYGMLRAIYKESMAYPVYCYKLIERDSFDFDNMINGFYHGAKLLFDGGIPPNIEESSYVKWLCDFLIDSKERKLISDDELISVFSRENYVCRFTMFQSMLTWIFFHELAHCVQEHYKLKNSSDDSFHYSEMIEEQKVGQENYIDNHVREFLADIEGLYLTFRMMHDEGIFLPSNIYMLLYAQNSLFNLFYYKNSNRYGDISGVSNTHPHPKVRNKYMHLLFITIMSWDLNQPKYSHLKEAFMKGFDYYTSKSSLLAGIIWAMRHDENYDPTTIPNFLVLDGPNGQQVSEKYIDELYASATWQIEKIKSQHLIEKVDMNIFKLIDVSAFFKNC